MYFTIYQITNLVNGKIYIGKHKTSNLDDDYLGSGKILRRSIKKYGRHNFKKDILFVCDTEKEMNELEKILVNEQFIQRFDTYNIKLGGDGGFDHINSSENKIEFSRMGAARVNASGRGIVGSIKGGLVQKSKFEIMGICNLKEKIGDFATNSEKQKLATLLAKTPEAKEKRKRVFKITKHQQGILNSRYGTCWITHPIQKVNKSIQKDELDYYLTQGWCRGRKFDFGASDRIRTGITNVEG